MDTMGWDTVGDGETMGESIVVGAAPVRGRMGMRRLSVPGPSWMGNAKAQGVSTPSEEMDFLPMKQQDRLDGGGGGVPAGASAMLSAFPQRPFRGERPILTAFYVPAAAAAFDVSGAVVIDPAIYVGAVQVGASQGQTPFAAFTAQAFGVRLSFPPAGQGTVINIPARALIPIAAGDSIVLTGVIIGRAVR